MQPLLHMTGSVMIPAISFAFFSTTLLTSERSFQGKMINSSAEPVDSPAVQGILLGDLLSPSSSSLAPETDTISFKTAHEIAFHGKLYEITGNDTLKKFQGLLLPVFDYVQHSELIKKNVTIKKYVSHKGLVDTIENGSPEMFRNAMRNHLENYFARIFD